MADDRNAPDGDRDVAAPKKKSKTVLIIVLVNLLIIVGGGVYLAMFTNVLGGSEAQAEPEAGEHTETPAPKESEYFSLEPFIVNLNEQGAPRYLKLTISVECAGDKDLIGAAMPRVRDGVLTYLSGLRLTEVQGRDAKETLRQELVKILGQTIHAEASDLEIRSVLFTEFVVQ